MWAGNRAGFIPKACVVFGCCINADQNFTINKLLNSRSWYYVEPTSRETKKKGRTDVCSVVFTLRQRSMIAYIPRNNQSITIDKSIKIGKSDLIHIDCIDQSVAWIDDTLVAFIALTWFLPISSIYIGRSICSSVHPKMKTDFMQTVNLLTIELQLRVEGSNNYHFLKYTFKKIWKIFYFLQDQVYNPLLVCRRPVFHYLDLPPFQNNVCAVPGVVTSRSSQ